MQHYDVYSQRDGSIFLTCKFFFPEIMDLKSMIKSCGIVSGTKRRFNNNKTFNNGGLKLGL